MRIAADDKLHVIFGGYPDLLDGQMLMLVVDLDQRACIRAGLGDILDVKRAFVARMRQNINVIACLFIGVQTVENHRRILDQKRRRLAVK